jgi:hypothetical protein
MRATWVLAAGPFLLAGLAATQETALGAEWQPMWEAPYSTSPAIAVDGASRTLYAFGGQGSDALPGLYRQDLSLPNVDWVLESAGGGPPVRTSAHAIFDARRGRFLLLGGQSRRDCWAYDPQAKAWSPLADTTIAPANLSADYPLAYDARQDRLVYVEGAGTSGTRLWELPLGAGMPTWNLLPLSGAPLLEPRAVAVCDSVSNQLFVFGGGDDAFPVGTSRLHAIDLDTGAWTTRSSIHATAISPRIAIDPARRRLILLGSAGSFLNDFAIFEASIEVDTLVSALPWSGNLDADVWGSWTYDAVGSTFLVVRGETSRISEFSLNDLRWTRRWRPGRPLAIRGMAGAADPSRRVWYVHGGWIEKEGGCSGIPVSCVNGSLHRISLDDPADCEEVVPGGAGPGPRYDHAATIDSVGMRILFHGGMGADGVARSDLWALELDGAPRWTLVPTQGEAPASTGHALALDAERRHLYLVGGSLHRLDLSTSPATWERLPVTIPGGSVAGFDEVARRLVVGTGLAGYTIDLGTDPPLVSPVVSSGVDAGGIGRAYDPIRRRILLQNGYWFNSPHSGYWGSNRTFSFGGSVLEEVTVSSWLSPLSIGVSVYDPVRDRMLSLNGQSLVVREWGSIQWREPRPWFGTLELPFEPSSLARFRILEATRDNEGVRVLLQGTDESTPVRIDRWSELAPSWTEVGSVSASGNDELIFDDPEPLPGVELRYRGRWTDGGGEHVTATASVAPLPATVVLTSAEFEPGRIRLTWNATGGPRMIGIERREETSGTFDLLLTAVADPGSAGRFVSVDSVMVPGSTYRYRARFEDAFGMHVTPESDPLSLPTAALLVLGATEWVDGRLHLTFEATGDPQEVRIERRIPLTSTWGLLGPAERQPLGGAFVFVDSLVLPGRFQHYRARFEDGYGSHVTSETEPLGLPSTLVLVEGALTDGAVRLLYEANGMVGSVEVHRRIVGMEDWVRLGSTIPDGAAHHAFTDTTIFVGRTYRYRASFETGAGPAQTDPSAEFGLPSQVVRLQLRPVAGTVGRGWPVQFECRLESDAPASIELVDVTGRVAARSSVYGKRGDVVAVTLSPERPVAGIWFARLRQGPNVASARVVRL